MDLNLPQSNLAPQKTTPTPTAAVITGVAEAITSAEAEDMIPVTPVRGVSAKAGMVNALEIPVKRPIFLGCGGR